jgi:hypothetical protein
MPFWTAALFTAYTLHLLWQAVQMWPKFVKSGKPVLLILFAPFLLSKLALVVLALSYWSVTYCAASSQLSPWLLVIPAFLSLVEAMGMTNAIVENVQSIKGSPWFYPSLVAQVLVSLVIPVVLLLMAFRVLGLNQCAW